MQPTDDPLALKLIARCQALDSERSTWDDFWQRLANYIMPRKAEITDQMHYPDDTKHSRLFSSTAAMSNMTLAQGQMSWVSPMEDRWFVAQPPRHLEEHDGIRSWYAECSEIALLKLAQSNFYTEIHELYLNRGCFGTASLFVEEGKISDLRFKAHPTGSYSIAQDSEGNVDTVYRKFELSPRQAVQKFGADALHPQMREDARNPKKMDKGHEFLHVVQPRDEYNSKKKDGENKPIASYYVDWKYKKTVHESGYDEMPYVVTRYLEWTEKVESPYGWSPGWQALADIRQDNLLAEYGDTLCEVAAFPRILTPAGMEGDVDLRAGGQTTFDPYNEQAVPREWATSGRYDILKDRINDRKEAIKQAYHVDLFQMFAQLDKQMTAREVMERSSEKLIQFSPTFSKMTTELFNPLLHRVFGILLRKGAFPEPPAQLAGADRLPAPQFVYTSKIALAIQLLQNSAFTQTIEGWSPIFTVDPTALDNLDIPEAFRGYMRNTGMPESWIRPKEEVEAIQTAREEAAQRQAEIEQASRAVTAGAKLPPDERREMIEAI